MSPSERLAVAAHLHVLLRRKTGRVTDTEWMAVNAEYAAEIARFCRQNAADGTAPELAAWADKLDACHRPAHGTVRPDPRHTPLSTPAGASEPPSPGSSELRYIGGLR